MYYLYIYIYIYILYTYNINIYIYTHIYVLYGLTIDKPHARPPTHRLTRAPDCLPVGVPLRQSIRAASPSSIDSSSHPIRRPSSLEICRV